MEEEPAYPPHVDEVDLAILRLLREDSRTSIRGLARAIGMSPGAVGERVERLESKQIIRGYTVDLDAARLGLSLEVLIGVRLNARGSIQRLIAELSKLEGVVRVSVITGRWDLLVHMRVADHQKLAEALLDDVWNIKEIRDSETMMVLDTVAQDPFEV